MNADCLIIRHLKEKCDIRRFTFQGQTKNDYDVFRYRNPTNNLIKSNGDTSTCLRRYFCFGGRFPRPELAFSAFCPCIPVQSKRAIRNTSTLKANMKLTTFQMTFFLIVDLELNLDLTLIRLGG